ncbi:MAG: HPP family protein [Verrucomicrobiales bacterium]|nr:HPP family protein [Verrucomicrobiales bacterium]
MTVAPRESSGSLPAVTATALSGFPRRVANGLTVGFLALIALASTLPGAALLFFPELAALAYDVFIRPRGTWASAPVFLALTPALTAVIGIAMTLWLPFSVPSILLVVALCVLLVQWLRSPVAPAISAGVLPFMTGLESWWYPAAILIGTSGLALVASCWKRLGIAQLPEGPPGDRERVDDQMERVPRRMNWIPALLLFVTGAAVLVVMTGEKMILYPPLVVIAFEMFAHPHICPWARRPIRFPLAAALSAAVGVAVVLGFGSGVFATVIALLAGIAILKLFDLHMPPALAIGLIPQILEQPGWSYPLSVLTGSLILAAAFLIYRSLLRRDGRSGRVKQRV